MNRVFYKTPAMQAHLAALHEEREEQHRQHRVELDALETARRDVLQLLET